MNREPYWEFQRKHTAFLALEDGSIWRGYSVGAPRNAVGEAVFNTGMSGYQEILSDPSYRGQFVVMTFTEMGNTGTNDADLESERFQAAGLLVQNMNAPSNWRSETSLAERLQQSGTPAVAGIETRMLARHLRENGTLKGCIVGDGGLKEAEAVVKAREWPGLDGQDYASRVTCSRAYEWDPEDTKTLSWGFADTLPEPDMQVVAYDFGIKWNILRHLRAQGMRVTVVPAHTPACDVLAMKPDGVFLSNGPADPAAVGYAIETARALIGQVPLMGICLGHQILGLASGGRTYRLKFGHHGCNHPVQDLATGKVDITSQNHNFALAPDSLDPSVVTVTHINLNDHTVEGIRHVSAPMFAVQYHPEAGPGPGDPAHLFQRFRALIKKGA
jgi:carbamoyl-phosphate synthase small subunit